MNLSDDLIKKLSKKYEPSALLYLKHRGNDMAIKTDEEGNAIQLFLGKLKEDGNIRGDRYARKIIRDKEGNIIKDHWDRKGKAS
ncbi:MAG: hypothetical protein ICV51_22090 [Flavisolibacter sp.]|nr:hypothetical protein [Flavisolibacter sp.]